MIETEGKVETEEIQAVQGMFFMWGQIHLEGSGGGESVAEERAERWKCC